MQAPNAQGIMGLMSQGRTPQSPQQSQQPPVPSPMKASPMAGLGSVEDRVAAYRGNPAPLQQRYAMSQDLLDLLALQKIKSEKEAAARQMQLTMGQQQAAQGMEPQTVAQQREKEVMELTKNELAQQRGDTAQQQQAQQQGALQKLMSGIASAPGAGTAAQPKYAAGGIVAFAEGGDAEDERRKRREGESFSDYRRRMFDLDLQLQRERNATRDADREAERMRRIAERGGEIIPPSPFLDRKPLEMPGAPAQPAVSAAYPDESRRGAAANLPPAGLAAPRPPVAPTPAPAPTMGQAAPAARRPAMPGAPAAAPAAPAAPAGGLAALVDKTATGMMEQDPEARQLAMEKRIREAYALTPEQRAVFDQGIAQRQKMFEETYDPERQRREGLKQYLLGAGGRRYGEFAGGAGAAMAYDEGQRAQKLKDFEALQKSREGIVGLEREGIKPSIEGGLKALEVGEAGKRSGLEAGFRRVEGQLDRESREKIAADNNRVQAMIAQAQREGTLEVQRSRITQELNRLEQSALAALQKTPTAMTIKNLEQIKSFNPKGFTKEQQAELDAQYRKLYDLEDIVRAEMDAKRESAFGTGGTGSAKSGGIGTPEQRALVEQYTKGK